MIRDFYLPEAEMSLILDPLTTEHRMVLLSGCHSVSVCIECKYYSLPSQSSSLPPRKGPQSSRQLTPCNETVSRSIFEKALSNDSAGIDWNYPGRFVKYGRDGFEIVNQDAGIGFLRQYHEYGTYFCFLRARFFLLQPSSPCSVIKEKTDLGLL
jgi:hypothetical protein